MHRGFNDLSNRRLGLASRPEAAQSSLLFELVLRRYTAAANGNEGVCDGYGERERSQKRARTNKPFAQKRDMKMMMMMMIVKVEYILGKTT